MSDKSAIERTLEARRACRRRLMDGMPEAKTWDAALPAAKAELAQLSEAMRALESLTPSGSEFVGDVNACVAYVHKKISTLQNIAKNAALRANEGRAELASRGLEALRQKVEALPRKGYSPRSDVDLIHRKDVLALLPAERKAEE
jgi:hypothetical protein